MNYFKYGNNEKQYLCEHDKKMAWAIEKIDHINREVDTDLFTSIIHHIIGQQISAPALKTVWDRFNKLIPSIVPENITNIDRDKLQSIGITYRKTDYILDFANKVAAGKINIDSLWKMSDSKVIEILTSLNGIGIWTAEMIMIFCMQRQDIVSYGDLAIIRGMRMLYRHRKIDKKIFNKYRKRYSPYGTVASLYLWAIAGGSIPELTDPTPTTKIIKQ